jgi:hypothetical protein
MKITHVFILAGFLLLPAFAYAGDLNPFSYSAGSYAAGAVTDYTFTYTTETADPNMIFRALWGNDSGIALSEDTPTVTIDGVPQVPSEYWWGGGTFHNPYIRMGIPIPAGSDIVVVFPNVTNGAAGTYSWDNDIFTADPGANPIDRPLSIDALTLFEAGDLTIVGSNDFSGETGEIISIDDVQLTGVPDGDVSVKLLVSEGSLEMTTTAGLTFTGPSVGDVLFFSGSLEDVNTALATLEYTRLTTGVDTLEVSLVEPGEVFFADNGHLYEYITSAGDWNTAKTNAESLTRYGASGYLATINSLEENNFVNERLEDAGWMGASDAAVEGDWKWVTGPEAGTSFWSGAADGSVVGDGYENWNTGEPNNSGSNEDCGQFLSGGSGAWNDLPCSGTSLPGYVAEFGAPGDMPDVEAKNITITTNTIPVINTTTPVDDAGFASTVSDLVITFDQIVNIQTGNISIYTTADDELVEAIDVTGDQVTGTGTDTITINPTDDLDIATSYYVQIDATAFDSAIGLDFAGVLDSTTWNFVTTGIGSGSVQYVPTNPVIADEEDSVVITFTLDEPIVSAEPDPEVVVTLLNPLPDVLDFDTTVLTWTALAWDESRTVTITPDEAFTFTENINTLVEFTTTSESEYYDGYSSAIPLLIGAVGIDAPIPIQSVVESPDSPTVDTLSFTLESRPTEDVTITFVSNEGQVSFEPTSLTFTIENWNQSQSIVTTAIDDDDYEGVHSDTISFVVSSDDTNYHGFSITEVPVTILDDDPEPRAKSSTSLSRSYAKNIFENHFRSKENSEKEVNEEKTSTCSIEKPLTQNLKRGARDGRLHSFAGNNALEVALLQEYINTILADAYDSPAGPVDGIFGPLTQKGVERMQQALINRYGKNLGIYGVDGVVGPFTRNAINGWCNEISD